MNQRWRTIALWVLPIGVALFLGWQVLGNGASRLSAPNGPTVAPSNAAVARMSYGRFLDYVDAGRVTAVDIFDGGRTAVVEAVDPDLDNRVQRLRVDLPGLAPELVNKLKAEGISFDIHPPRTSPPVLGLLGIGGVLEYCAMLKKAGFVVSRTLLLVGALLLAWLIVESALAWDFLDG